MAVEDEATSKKKVLKKEYGIAATTKPGMQKKAPARRIIASKPDLMARGVAIDLLQMDKRVGPRYEAAEYEDLSGEKNLTLDRIVADDRRSHQAL